MIYRVLLRSVSIPLLLPDCEKEKKQGIIVLNSISI